MMESEGKKEVHLRIQDETFKCTKESLMSSSDYFKAMFSSNFIESQKSSIELKDIDPDIMRRILCFISGKSSRVFEDVKTCLSVLQYASMLQFSKIQKLCEDFLTHGLSAGNCLEIYEVAFMLDNLSVCEAALTFALWFFEDVVEREQFLKLNFEFVCNYLSKAELNLGVLGEWAVWEAIISWIEHDEAERKTYILPLLLCLDFSRLTSDDIASMAFYDYISADESAKRVLHAVVSNKMGSLNSTLEAKREEEKEHTAEEEEWRGWAKKAVEKEKNFRRYFSSVPCFVSSEKTLTFERETSCPIVFCYDGASGNVQHLVTLSKVDQTTDYCIGYRVCAVGPSILITGGQYMIGSSHWNNDVWAYSTITKQWRVLPALPSPRRNHMTCVLDSVIYLIGGYGKHRISLSTVDALDIRSGVWLKCRNIPFYGLGAACAYKNRVLVFAHCALHTFYPDRNTWVTSELDQRDTIQKNYCAAVPYHDSVFLMEMHSKRVCRITPDVSNMVEYFGSFWNETFNVCLMAPHLVSFSMIKNSADGSALVMETLFLEDKEEMEQIGDEFKNEQNVKHPKDNPVKEEEMERGRRGRIVLKEIIPSNHPFSHYTLNDISYGCFPLFKIQKECI